MIAVDRVGLRTRLAIALVSIAVLTVALATLFANSGLDPLVEDAARARLQRSADHFAEITAAVYEEERSWSPVARETLGHLAELDGLRVAGVIDGVRFGAGFGAAQTAVAVVQIGGRTIGRIEVAQDRDQLLTPEEEHLQHSLDRLHLVAGAASIVAALALAFVLAETLSRPLRRIRLAAERIAGGELQTRVAPMGDPEIRSVAHALNRLAETLEHEEEIRKHTVADLAHELRTPVNGLLTRIEAMQDGVLTGPDNVEAMHDEALRLTRLLNDLARLADAEQPGLLLEMRAVDLADVAQSTATSLAPLFEDAGIELALELRPAWVSGNADRLEQVATNLLSNALRYTDPGGLVRVRTATVGRDAMLEVHDTGVGIAPDELRHVFTRFWRGDPSRSRTTGGTGIGLAIVRELVRAHDGRVDLESKVGEGSRFRVLFPSAGSAPSVRGDAAPPDR